MTDRSFESLQAQFPIYAELLRRDRAQIRRNRAIHACFYACLFVWSIWCGLMLGPL